MLHDRGFYQRSAVYDTAQCSWHWALCVACFSLCRAPCAVGGSGLRFALYGHAPRGRQLRVRKPGVQPLFGFYRQFFPMVWAFYCHRGGSVYRCALFARCSPSCRLGGVGRRAGGRRGAPGVVLIFALALCVGQHTGRIALRKNSSAADGADVPSRRHRHCERIYFWARRFCPGPAAARGAHARCIRDRFL